MAAIAMLQEIRARVGGRLLDDLNQDEWRELFTSLNLEIHARDKNNPASYLGAESHNSKEVPEMDIRWGLPLQAEAVGDIVFNSPCQGKGDSFKRGASPPSFFFLPIS